MKETVVLRAGDMVVFLPRSLFREDVEGVVQVGEHQVPAKVIYAAWALGADQGVKAGVVLGAGLVLFGLLLLLLLRRALRGVWARRVPKVEGWRPW
ncbi:MULTISPECIES: hypothetical protein [unclassified Thermus]|jgi:hypothetical protein|uniref:hypothetical protein n=1 Tax=unclassified Thermus TaxID=2619321 RepID=UPI0025EFD71C|nr:hypothetical protein [Thermus sp.]MCS6869574.1 hypothetical protein [Thermus sp.]MCX7850201.1 hypothetical protein [Thermus sp.]MDW8017213.1 hypothetical protein [Thermus sp.]MDW8357619.1 hypothetical protein [Thermus sp.]